MVCADTCPALVGIINRLHKLAQYMVKRVALLDDLLLWNPMILCGGWSHKKSLRLDVKIVLIVTGNQICASDKTAKLDGS